MDIFQKKHPLIHCITNPISLNDCANILLALGANPIMAQHPQEVKEITSGSDALALNLGNFEDTRAQAMKISADCAHRQQIPMVLDIVGVACSTIRKNFALDLIRSCHPNVIKGNLSEWKALCQQKTYARGIDTDPRDQESEAVIVELLESFAQRQSCVALCTGKVDIVTDGKKTVQIHNGCQWLSRITGTGCMLNVCIAAFLSQMESFEACIEATCFYEVAAQKASCAGPGSFHMHFMDEIDRLTETDRTLFRIEEREG